MILMLSLVSLLVIAGNKNFKSVLEFLEIYFGVVHINKSFGLQEWVSFTFCD